MKRPPGALPIFDAESKSLRDGVVVQACRFCREKLEASDPNCLRHYARLATSFSSFRMCPYGFTSISQGLPQSIAIITGVVAFPRFNDSKEMARSKIFPGVKATRDAMLADIEFYRSVENSVVEIQKEAEARLPQALHELRKLNAIVKSNADGLGGNNESSAQEVRDIYGAAELMSNIFEVIEALSNVDHLSSLNMDEFVAVYDLAFKSKRIYQVRARIKPIYIHVDGEQDLAIKGSKKVFPLVFTVLLENAIKYGKPDSTVSIRIGKEAGHCIISVTNRSDHPIDATRCFERGTRYAGPSADGDGLGLFLAKAIVNAHSGEILCIPNEGSVTMRVKVPLHPGRMRR